MSNLLLQKPVSVSKKRILLFLLVGLFCFIQPINSLAAEPIISSEGLEDKIAELDKPNIVEKYLTGLLVGLGNAVITIFQAHDVSALVFQRPEVIENAFLANDDYANRDNLIHGIFPVEFFKGVEAIYNDALGILPIPMVVILAISGVIMVVNMTISPENRTRAKELIAGAIFAVVLMKFGFYLWRWIIEINFWIVDLVYTTLKASGIEVTTFLGTIWNAEDYDKISSIQNIGVGLMVLVAFFMTFVMNYQYMMRMLTLGILIVVFPFVILAAMIPSRRSALNLWFGEFTSQVFMQAAHALALGLVFFSVAKLGDLGFWIVMATLIGMPALAHIVRRIVSSFIGEGGGAFNSAFGNMSGAGSVMAMTMMFKRMGGKQGKSGNSDGPDGERLSVQGGSENLYAGNTPTPGSSAGGNAPLAGSVNDSSVPSPVSSMMDKQARKERRGAMVQQAVAMAGMGGAAIAGTMVGGDQGGRTAGMAAASLLSPGGTNRKNRASAENDSNASAGGVGYGEGSAASPTSYDEELVGEYGAPDFDQGLLPSENIVESEQSGYDPRLDETQFPSTQDYYNHLLAEQQKAEQGSNGGNEETSLPTPAGPDNVQNSGEPNRQDENSIPSTTPIKKGGDSANSVPKNPESSIPAKQTGTPEELRDAILAEPAEINGGDPWLNSVFKTMQKQVAAEQQQQTQDSTPTVGSETSTPSSTETGSTPSYETTPVQSGGTGQSTAVISPAANTRHTAPAISNETPVIDNNQNQAPTPKHSTNNTPNINQERLNSEIKRVQEVLKANEAIKQKEEVVSSFDKYKHTRNSKGSL